MYRQDHNDVRQVECLVTIVGVTGDVCATALSKLRAQILPFVHRAVCSLSKHHQILRASKLFLLKLQSDELGRLLQVPLPLKVTTDALLSLTNVLVAMLKTIKKKKDEGLPLSVAAYFDGALFAAVEPLTKSSVCNGNALLHENAIVICGQPISEDPKPVAPQDL